MSPGPSQPASSGAEGAAASITALIEVQTALVRELQECRATIEAQIKAAQTADEQGIGAVEPPSPTFSTVSASTATTNSATFSVTPPKPQPSRTTVQTASPAESGSAGLLESADQAAQLVRAQVTKLSLLFFTPPYTPSAILPSLRQLRDQPVPVLGAVASVLLSTPSPYPRALREEVVRHVRRVLEGLGSMLERTLPLATAHRAGRTQRPQELATTKDGLVETAAHVWNGCDELGRLAARGGGARFLVRKVEEQQVLLKDVLEELKGWGEEEEEEEEDGDDDDEGQGSGDEAGQDEGNLANNGAVAQAQTHHDDVQAMLDDMLQPGSHIPAGDPDGLRRRLDLCVKRMRLTTLLYAAVVKRRLKTLPEDVTEWSGGGGGGRGGNITSRLDAALPRLAKIWDRYELTTLAFYELDHGEVDRQMEAAFFESFSAAQLLMKNWSGELDEFSVWAEKFQALLKQQ